MAAPTAPPVEETLAWEAAQRTRAAIAALLAGVLTLLGNALQSGVYSDLPKVYAVDALRDAAGLPIPGGQGLRTAQIRFLDDKGTELLLTGVLIAVGAVLVAPALGYLFRATRARRPTLPQMALWAVLLGPLLVAIGGLVAQVTLVVQAHQFAGGHDFSSQAARDALGGGALLAGQLARQLGILAMALGFVLVALHAMRAGLLTRFMGILGILAGVLFVLPLGSSLPIVQSFWLIALGPLLLGRWPSGVPPAWTSGEAMPWPSQQELREQRQAAAGGGGDEGSAAAAEPQQDRAGRPAGALGGGSASKKRKRKRR
jgi:hypothetical protein